MQLPAKRWNEIPAAVDMVAFSNVRWDFVWQRPQHLMSRWAERRRVFFVEDPIFDGKRNYNELISTRSGVRIVVPHLKEGVRNVIVEMKRLIHSLFMEEAIVDYLLWYWQPMAYAYTQHLSPLATIYDCREDLTSLPLAPSAMRENEVQLMSRANVVFTGGVSLCKHKKQFHNNVYAIPSSVDVDHFRRAGFVNGDPPDQEEIPHPRIGYSGVIDERLDLQLLAGLASARPAWSFVVLGPIINVHPRALPQAGNIHYLGRKNYKELPQYLAGWDVAVLPFVKNESTRFLSPGKVPEYLAAGKPVVSTSIPDIVHPYGDMNLVRIADSHSSFINAITRSLSIDSSDWLARVDQFLKGTSWDKAWTMMDELMSDCIKKVPAPALPLSESLPSPFSFVTK